MSEALLCVIGFSACLVISVTQEFVAVRAVFTTLAFLLGVGFGFGFGE